MASFNMSHDFPITRPLYVLERLQIPVSMHSQHLPGMPAEGLW